MYQADVPTITSAPIRSGAAYAASTPIMAPDEHRPPQPRFLSHLDHIAGVSVQRADRRCTADPHTRPETIDQFPSLSARLAIDAA